MAPAKFVAPSAESRRRIMLLGTMTPAWYQLDDAGKRDKVLGVYGEVLRGWQESGLNVLGTFDDDLFVAGPPVGGRSSFYILGEVVTWGAVVDMLNGLRHEHDGIRMDTYVQFEARLGRPLFLLEHESGEG